MTPRQHCRAFLRFIGPWSDNGEACFWAYGFACVASVICSIFTRDASIATAVIVLIGYLAGINVAWRVLIVAMPAVFSRRLRGHFVDEWQEAGAEPLASVYLAYLHDLRASTAYHRRYGASRKQARVSARRNALMRRSSAYVERPVLPWRIPS